jgi:hypothetical protein
MTIVGDAGFPPQFPRDKREEQHFSLAESVRFRIMQPNICQKAPPMMDDGQFSFR